MFNFRIVNKNVYKFTGMYALFTENVYKFTFCIHDVYKGVYMYTNLYTYCNDAMFTSLLLLYTIMLTMQRSLHVVYIFTVIFFLSGNY